MSDELHFLPQHGHYRHLQVYRVAEALYDLTFTFCQRFLPPYGDRTVDQMVQAARTSYRQAQDEQFAALKRENANLRQRVRELEETVRRLLEELSEISESSESSELSESSEYSEYSDHSDHSE